MSKIHMDVLNKCIVRKIKSKKPKEDKQKMRIRTREPYKRHSIEPQKIF